MASRGRDARHRHRDARTRAVVASASRSLRRLDLLRRREGPRPTLRLSRRSPWLGRARPAPRRARAPSRRPGQARRLRRAPRHRQEISRSFWGKPMNSPCIRKGAAAIALLSGLAWISPAVAQQPPQPPPHQPAFRPEVVVTATGYPEEVSKIAGTVQVISQDRIAHSNAKSVTELLAENSVGFMSQWTAGRTSLTIRGGATDGQGRDFTREELILLH